MPKACHSGANYKVVFGTANGKEEQIMGPVQSYDLNHWIIHYAWEPIDMLSRLDNHLNWILFANGVDPVLAESTSVGFCGFKTSWFFKHASFGPSFHLHDSENVILNTSWSLLYLSRFLFKGLQKNCSLLGLAQIVDHLWICCLLRAWLCSISLCGWPVSL